MGDGKKCYFVMRNFFSWTSTQQKLNRPPSFPASSIQTTAPTPNRRRIRPRSRPRTISCGLGRSNIGVQSDLHKLYPSPFFIKVLPGFFKSRVSPRISIQTTAPTSNRRRIRPRSRPRTISCGLGRSNIGAQSDLHKLYPSHPPHKSFAELFQKRPFPSFPASPTHLLYGNNSKLRITVIVSLL